MASVFQRVWRSGPRRVRRVAWGYTCQVNGKQQRKFDGSWTKEDAENALAARLLAVEQATAPPPPMTLGEAIERYERVKAGKRSLAEDQRHMATAKTFFGGATPLVAIKSGRIAQ